MRLAPARSILRALLVATLALSATAAAAQEPRVLVALDSSRSLSAEQSRDASALARDLVARLAATQPSVLSFDDSVHWLARPGEEGAEAALAAVRPTGRYTVLNDGLIEGVRSLENGGVLVVISDGKDENSATTIEDVARLASERGVRVVTLGAGRIDERTMKRLALLTGGRYAGAAADVDPDALAAEIETLRSQVVAEKAPPAATLPSAPPAPAAVATPAPPPAAAPASGGSRLLLLVGALVAAAGIVIGFLLARRRTAVEELAPPEEPEAGTKPGVAAPEPPPAHAREPEPTPVDEAQLERLRRRPPVPAGGLFEVTLDDSAAFQRLPFPESIERTLVLTEEIVLTVREPKREARSFRLPPDRAIDIGRDAKLNTLAFQDPTLSVQHLRLALEEGEVFLVDLGSTNGVVYRERRVESARLHPGDRFRAGMIEFELHLHRASLV